MTPWLIHINSDNDFKRFKYIHKSVSAAHVWKFPSNSSEIRTALFIGKLISTAPTHVFKFCEICDRPFTDVFVHACFGCTCTSNMHSTWMGLIIENFCLDLYVELSECDDDSLYTICLGKNPSTMLSDPDLESFKRLCYIHVTKSASEYNRQLNNIV